MLQSVSTSQCLNPPVSASTAEAMSGDPLLRFAGPVAGSHALVIAPNGLDLMCSLLRQGCVAVTALRPSERSDHETYDLVLAPRIASSAQIGRLIYQAKRALVPTGRFLAFVPTGPAEPDQDVAGLLVRSVRMGGFVAVQTRTVKDGLMLRADLPMHGLSNAMPVLLRRQA
ncbi:hypothetical protein [Acidisphaera sp. L21]|uniref:hypothetical protein n=1 Tax=Acidisphaera sp. L21 TaxID=1641851 RepID=UPI00131B95B5|nr:hypothetical protein [Acidisphaera sp. L21]